MSTTLNEMRRWIDENQDAYHEAMQKMGDRDFVRSFMAQVKNWMGDVVMYKPHEHPSDVAVAIVSRLQVQSGAFMNDIQFIEQFEEERARFNEARKELDGQEERS